MAPRDFLALALRVLLLIGLKFLLTFLLLLVLFFFEEFLFGVVA